MGTDVKTFEILRWLQLSKTYVFRIDTRINRNMFDCLNPLVLRHPIKLYASDGTSIVTYAKFGGNDSGGDWMIACYSDIQEG